MKTSARAAQSTTSRDGMTKMNWRNKERFKELGEHAEVGFEMSKSRADRTPR
jgi:hypothetical protein